MFWCFSQCFLCFLCIRSRLLDHVFSLFYFPYLLNSSYFYYKYGTIQHAIYTIHNHNHIHKHMHVHKHPPHVHLPLTVILRVVWYAWAGQSQGKLWRRLVAILTGKSFVILGYKVERLIEPSGSLRSFPQDNWSWTTLSRKATDYANQERIVLDLFSNFKFVRSSGYFRSNPSSKW